LLTWKPSVKSKLQVNAIHLGEENLRLAPPITTRGDPIGVNTVIILVERSADTF